MIFQFEEGSMNAPDPMTLVGADDNILTYAFVDDPDAVPEPFTFCLCAEGPLNTGGLGGVNICCDLSVSIGNPTPVSFTTTTATYRIDVTITNDTVGACTDRVVRFTPSGGNSVNLTVGVNSVLFVAPIEGGSIDLEFTNVCSGSTFTAGASVPGVPCCPVQSVINPSFTFISQNGTTQRVRGQVDFAYTGNTGCVLSSYYVRGTGLNQLLTVGTNTFDFEVPVGGGPYNIEIISDLCGNVANTFSYTIPALSCCPFNVAITSINQTYDPIDDEIDLVVTIEITETGTGCISGDYEFTSIYHNNTLAAGTNVLTFSADNVTQNIAAVITQDCSGNAFSRLVIPTTEMECCPFDIVWPVDTPPVNTGGTNWDHTIQVITTGVNCYESDSYEVTVVNTGQTVTLGAFDTHTFSSDLGALDGIIEYEAVSACGSVAPTLEVPFGNPCCGLIFTDISDVFPSGLPTSPGFTNYQIDITTAHTGTCGATTYDVYVDAVLVGSGVPVGAYAIQYDLPENTSQTVSITFESSCDGSTYGFFGVWEEPPCCAVGALTITITRIADTTGTPNRPTYQTRVTGAAQTLGCDVSTFFLESNVFATQVLTPATIPTPWGGTPFTFTIDPTDVPSAININVSSACAGIMATQTRDLPDCCSLISGNHQLLGTLDFITDTSVRFNVNAGRTISPTIEQCVDEIFTITTPHGLSHTFTNYTPGGTQLIANHPLGATDITFTLTSSCAGPVRTLTIPIPTPPCCPLDLSVVSLLPTGRIEASALARLEYTLTLDLDTTLLPGECNFVPTYTLFHDTNPTGDSSIPLAGVPITAGINTFNVFVKGTTFNWNLRVQSCCGCVQSDTLLYVPPLISSLTNCCPISIVGVSPGTPIPLVHHAGNIYKFDVEFTQTGTGCLASPVRFFNPSLAFNFTQQNTGHCPTCSFNSIGTVDIDTPTTVYVQFTTVPPSGMILDARFQSFCLASIALPFTLQMP